MLTTFQNVSKDIKNHIKDLEDYNNIFYSNFYFIILLDNFLASSPIKSPLLDKITEELHYIVRQTSEVVDQKLSNYKVHIANVSSYINIYNQLNRMTGMEFNQEIRKELSKHKDIHALSETIRKTHAIIRSNSRATRAN